MIPVLRTSLRSRPVMGTLRPLARFNSTQGDERMVGPYPKVKFEYYNERPQYPEVEWDDKQARRNFGEPLHHQYDLIDTWSPDHFRQRPDSTAFRWNLYFIALVLGFSGYCYYTFEGPNFVRRSYPDGLQKSLGDETTHARVDASWGK